MAVKRYGIIFWLSVVVMCVSPTCNASKPSTERGKKGKILFFHPAGTKSHILLMGSLAEGLARDGHDVTTAFFAKTPITNLTNYHQLTLTDRYFQR